MMNLMISSIVICHLFEELISEHMLNEKNSLSKETKKIIIQVISSYSSDDIVSTIICTFKQTDTPEISFVQLKQHFPFLTLYGMSKLKLSLNDLICLLIFKILLIKMCKSKNFKF